MKSARAVEERLTYFPKRQLANMLTQLGRFVGKAPVAPLDFFVRAAFNDVAGEGPFPVGLPSGCH